MVLYIYVCCFVQSVFSSLCLHSFAIIKAINCYYLCVITHLFFLANATISIKTKFNHAVVILRNDTSQKLVSYASFYIIQNTKVSKWQYFIKFLTLHIPWNSVWNCIVFLLSFKTFVHILWISQWKMLIIPEAVYNEILTISPQYICVNHRHRWKDGRKACGFVGFFSSSRDTDMIYQWYSVEKLVNNK